MNTKEIEVISEIVNFQRFSDAADSLSYSHSAISKYVTSVENELDIKLFVRGNKACELSLTPEGKVLVPAIQRINNDYKYLLDLVNQFKNTSNNVLRIGSSIRFGNVTEQELLASFMCQTPEVTLEQSTMFTRDLLKMLKANRLDVIFIAIPDYYQINEYLQNSFDVSELDLKFIKSEKQLYVAVSENFAPDLGSEAPFSAFKDYTFAFPSMHTVDDCEIMNVAEALASKSGFELKTITSSVYGSTIFRLASKAQFAFLTTNIENFYNEIKFVRVSDWDKCFNIYLLSQKSNKKKSLMLFKQHCAKYEK